MRNTSQQTAPKAQSMKEILVPLIAIIVGMFMVILDGTAMNVALPGLIADFNSSLSLLQWTVTGYALAMAAIIPLAGWLSDKFGTKQIFLVSIVLFTIGSGLCAFAVTAEQLIICRIIQGLGGGMVAPIAMAITYRISPPEKVGAVMGMIGIPMLLAPALGPVVAGWLVEYYTWHWIFLINLPIGVVAVFLGLRTLPKLERQTTPALDWLGMIFAPLAFASLVYGVSSAGGGEGGEASGWSSPEALLGIGIGLVALIIFIIVELRRSNPLLELRVFSSGNFTRGIIVQWISQIALFGSIFLLPIFLQQVKGYGALDTGLILLPQAIAAGLFMPIGGKLYDKFGARPVVIAGMVIVSGAALLLTQMTEQSGLGLVMTALAMLGAGMGLSMMPLNTHIIQSAPAHLVGRVTSLTNAAQQVMVAFAIAGLSTLLLSRGEFHMAQSPGPGAFYAAYSDTYYVVAAIGIVGMLLGFMLRRPQRAQAAAADGDAAEQAKVGMMMGH